MYIHNKDYIVGYINVMCRICSHLILIYASMWNKNVERVSTYINTFMIMSFFLQA